MAEHPHATPAPLHDPAGSYAALRLGAALGHVLPGSTVEVATPAATHRFGPGVGAGTRPLACLRDALGESLRRGDPTEVATVLRVAPSMPLEVELVLPPGGPRAIGGGLYEVTWAGRITCCFATLLDEAAARAAVREAATYPSGLDGVPVSALGLDPAPDRVAVVHDPATGTTLFGLDRRAGGHAAITSMVRTAMTAAHAACLVAELAATLRAAAPRPGGA